MFSPVLLMNNMILDYAILLAIMDGNQSAQSVGEDALQDILLAELFA